MDAFKSVWFWILLLGLIAIIVGLIIGICKAEMNWWAWGFIIAGILLIAISLLLAFFNLSKECNHEHVANLTRTPIVYSTPTYVSSPVVNLSPLPDTRITSPVSSTVVQSISPTIRPIPKLPPITMPASNSPLPSLSNTNIPQAQRGFASSSVDLSALAPI